MRVVDLLRLPDPFDSLEERERFLGVDLTRFSRRELLRERDRLKLALLIVDERHEASTALWLAERLTRVTELL